MTFFDIYVLEYYVLKLLHLETVTFSDATWHKRCVMLRFVAVPVRDDDKGYKARQCTHSFQGGLPGDHKSPPVRHKHMLSSPNLQLPTKKMKICGGWAEAGVYFRKPVFLPPSVLQPGTSQARPHVVPGQTPRYVGKWLQTERKKNMKIFSKIWPEHCIIATCCTVGP